MIAWNDIDTVLLDMDGTLLDLAFDNWFWQQHIPLKYADQNGIPADQAHKLIKQWIDRHQGTLNWYCLDFWSAELGLDISALKRDAGAHIRYRPGAEDFLQELKDSGRQIIMVTNAHPDALMVKKERTGLERGRGDRRQVAGRLQAVLGQPDRPGIATQLAAHEHGAAELVPVSGLKGLDDADRNPHLRCHFGDSQSRCLACLPEVWAGPLLFGRACVRCG